MISIRSLVIKKITNCIKVKLVPTILRLHVNEGPNVGYIEQQLLKSE